MQGLMQDKPLLISSLIEHAATFHPEQEIVSRSIEGPIHRTNYRRIAHRAKQVANVLNELGVEFGDRVGTLAWNTWRHMELYFGVSGSGAVLHTVNPRLFPEQVEYILNHAEDKVLFFDISFAPLVEKLVPKLKSIEHFVALTDRAHMPQADIPGLLCYEDLVEGASAEFAWPEFDERTASSLCYTSGTTGNPKGVLYSHRSTVLHSLMAMAPDAFNVSVRSTLLLVVPMFHANAWGMPYVAAMVGAKMVLPGEHLDGEHLYPLMRDERVTFSQAVPTVWLMFFQYLDAHPELDLDKELCIDTIGIGGSAPPRAMVRRLETQLGAQVIQGWGMTETSPLGVVNRPLPKHDDLDRDGLDELKVKQGRGIWGVHIKIVNDEGGPQPWDGVHSGHLYIRGPWIANGYFRAEGGNVLDDEGYFPTGDIATMDPDGYLQLVDRAKDVIKSGGEWISSMDLENAAFSHPGVAEAAVIAIPHEKWQERPLMVVVKRAGAQVDEDEIMAHLAERVVKWWLPDDIVFVDELPHTATGKLLKTKLREQFAGYRPRREAVRS
ncbi:Putative ACYL-COA SYNTHETASE ligase PROTEIN, similar to alkK [Alloalcanivorax dieselolei B5]|uniref:Putative ACYL-COA SYNTHETASE ligase PROTEIN, similar to alkK n=1 Tax=Alcanivorax dieselolei (strain DSM 16502 / CGMCC 1.3690 / MCCC 1A00001 / B-5) TaxID=930169 RepID=K0CG12_ALCDB|nr:long-chain-fatty-acid--CoA ligase [Alloalcanivorax dieselolei]AFT72469.1 Putative ACYL-COA SYNTHETASE ligase PROTEIN, similar to alkK [Alloalcanivorax dieselolei B5]GGJ78115.1 long-chain-fatty-acid--CoA ligase [Alloalcanivorax dieselolei]